MAINYEIRDGVIEATFHGKVTREDIQQLLESITDLEARYEITPDRITDLSDASLAELRTSDLVAFAERRGIAKLKNKVKSAVIAPGSTQYGLARMFLAHNHNPDIEIMIFRDASSAYNWVGLKEKGLAKPGS